MLKYLKNSRCWLRSSKYWFSECAQKFHRVILFGKVKIICKIVYQFCNLCFIYNSSYINYACCFIYMTCPSFYFFFLMTQWNQAKMVELTVKMQMHDEIIYGKWKVHWLGFTAKFAFLACLCLVLSPLNDRLEMWKTNKTKQLKNLFFLSILWMMMGACLC